LGSELPDHENATADFGAYEAPLLAFFSVK